MGLLTGVPAQYMFNKHVYILAVMPLLDELEPLSGREEAKHLQHTPHCPQVQVVRSPIILQETLVNQWDVLCGLMHFHQHKGSVDLASDRSIPVQEVLHEPVHGTLATAAGVQLKRVLLQAAQICLGVVSIHALDVQWHVKRTVLKRISDYTP